MCVRAVRGMRSIPIAVCVYVVVCGCASSVSRLQQSQLRHSRADLKSIYTQHVDVFIIQSIYTHTRTHTYNIYYITYYTIRSLYSIRGWRSIVGHVCVLCIQSAAAINCVYGIRCSHSTLTHGPRNRPHCGLAPRALCVFDELAAMVWRDSRMRVSFGGLFCIT